MKDQNSGIKAIVRPYHPTKTTEPYYEYLAPPQSPLYTGNANERYIEAVTNEQFEVYAEIPKTFDFGRSTHVEIEYVIDGGAAYGSHYEKLKYSGKKIKDWHNKMCRRTGNEWEDVGFVFAATKCTEQADLSASEEDHERAKRGKIEISIQLGKYPDSGSKVPFEDDELLRPETSKKIAIDHGKSHSIQYVSRGMRDEAPMQKDWDWIPARGENGKPIVFTFFYASRMILELKKIIPPTGIADLPQSMGLPLNQHDMQARVNTSSTKSASGQPCAVETGQETAVRTEAETSESSPLQHVKHERLEVSTAAPEQQLSVKRELIEDHSVAPRTSRPQTKAKEVISLDSDDEGPPPHKKIKTEATESDASMGKPSITPATTVGSAASGGQSERARRKAKLELQLEEVKLRQQLMELEEGV